MLENLADLRKGLWKMITLEREGDWYNAQHFYKITFVPSLELVGAKMGLTRDEVRKLL